MPLINISGLEDNNDPFYRYKRDLITIQNQKTKTAITNLDKISTDLSREPKMIIDYFKKKLGVSFTSKKGQYITPKIFTVNELEKCLREYTQDFVLCSVCSLPETDLSIDDNGNLQSKCKCCSNIHTFDYSSLVDNVIKTIKNKKKKKKN